MWTISGLTRDEKAGNLSLEPKFSDAMEDRGKLVSLCLRDYKQDCHSCPVRVQPTERSDHTYIRPHCAVVCNLITIHAHDKKNNCTLLST